jgi:hypothetical protein
MMNWTIASGQRKLAAWVFGASQSLQFFSLKGWDNIAQGNALGM